MRLFLCILTTIVAVGLNACGQTGPLRLPDQPPKATSDSEFDAQPANRSDQPRNP
jgi:predicted small lipoprotein YifL